MKKLVLAMAVAAAPMAAMADASGPKFYGKVNVSVQNAKEDNGESVVEVKSNASRLGVKGKIALDHGLKGVYKAEYEISVDGDKQEFKQRNIYGGIASQYGEVIVGKFDTPLKKVQKKVDLFNDLEGDIKNTITKSDNRTANNIQYTSPKVNGFQGKVAHIASEEANGREGTSLSITYNQDDIYLGYAFDTDVEGENIEVSRLVAQISIDALTLGALYEGQDNGTQEDEGFLVSAAYKLGKTKLKAQYGRSDINAEDGQTISVGADYKLAKKAKVYAYYTDNSFDDSANDDRFTGVGFEYKF